jgi:hypothetical protein
LTIPSTAINRIPLAPCGLRAISPFQEVVLRLACPLRDDMSICLESRSPSHIHTPPCRYVPTSLPQSYFGQSYILRPPSKINREWKRNGAGGCAALSATRCYRVKLRGGPRNRRGSIDDSSSFGLLRWQSFLDVLGDSKGYISSTGTLIDFLRQTDAVGRVKGFGYWLFQSISQTRAGCSDDAASERRSAC